MNTKKLEIQTYGAQPKPILKWAGGKQQMVDILLSSSPKQYNKYIEPFIGGGALFFATQPSKAVISDSNAELINLYKVVSSDVEDLISLLKDMRNTEEEFYRIRALDTSKMSDIEKAARMMYLNKTCYNGLYRVNRKGQFNAPYGKYKKPNICDEDKLRAASLVLKQSTIVHGDYKNILQNYAEPGDFIFLDPPYLPVSKYADFKRYTKEQFYEEDQLELAEEVDRLAEMGCNILLTNSNHPLVHRLYGKYKISVHQTKRYINSDASKRTGEDVLVKIEPVKKLIVVPKAIELPAQVESFPATRFMGSKQNLLKDIWSVASEFKFESVLDLFSGSGVVGYMFKTQNKLVMSNDYMSFSSCLAKSMIENNQHKLSQNDLEMLCTPNPRADQFVTETFRDLYFSDEDNMFIDQVRANLKGIKNEYKRAIAQAALVRACLKKRPRGIFTYTGYRYDDGRRDLTLSLNEQFIEAVEQINGAVFNNGKENKVRNGDAMDTRLKADLVYIDPPYFSPLSDNEYVRRYHFLEGLVRDWKGVEMQWHTKTKKFKSYPTPFSTEKGAYDAFDLLFKRHRDSIIMVSYSSNSLPTKDDMLKIMSKYKSHVEVIEINHRYSVGNQGHKVGDNKNEVKEYLFVGFDT